MLGFQLRQDTKEGVIVVSLLPSPASTLSPFLPQLLLQKRSSFPNALVPTSRLHTQQVFNKGMLLACCCCKVASVVPNSVRPCRRQPTRLPCPWDSPRKNSGVGCHFPLQCMKAKSESEDAQSCPILGDPMDCRLPGSSVYGIFQAWPTEPRKGKAVTCRKACEETTL